MVSQWPEHFDYSTWVDTGDDPYTSYHFSEVEQSDRQKFIDLCLELDKLEKLDEDLFENLDSPVNPCVKYFYQGIWDGTWTIDQLIALSPEERRNIVRREKVRIERATTKEKGRFQLIRHSDIQFADNLPGQNWIIDHLIPEQGFCMLYGKSGSHKTYMALDIAASIAASHKTWRDGRAINADWFYPVAYIASEGGARVKSPVRYLGC